MVEDLVMDVLIQIWILSSASVLMTIFVAWQAYILGRTMNSSFGKWEVAAWVVITLYRSYGLYHLSDDVVQLQRAGYIVDSLTFRQWTGTGGYIVFISLMMISKHVKRKRIKEAWGDVLSDSDKSVKFSIDKLTMAVEANTATGLRSEAADKVVAENLVKSQEKADQYLGEEPGQAADAAAVSPETTLIVLTNKKPEV